MRRRAPRWAVVLGCVAVLSTAACTADPPPPVQQSETPPPATDVPQGQTISVATDSIGVGLNPHLSADQSPVTAAVAAMTLPSAFIPSAGPGGVSWALDTAVLDGAEVTSQSPFTVTYRIAQDAQWSDGLPVTADDFSYLWQQMSRQPGTIAPAGYRLIDDVASRAGGKEAVVRFRTPYPAWRELFSAMLPSHVLRGVPQGFQTGMDVGLPVSAGRYSITVIDTSRDEVRLQRNDRFWRTPAVVDQIVLHRVGTASQLAESIRSTDTRVVALAGGPALAGTLSAIPGVATGRTPVGRSLGVTVNTRTPSMSLPSVRQAVLGIIDPQVLTDASAGESTVTPFAGAVLVPTDPGYVPVDSTRPSPEAISSLLSSAGYFPVPSAVSTTPTGSGTTTGTTTPTTTTPTTTTTPSTTDAASGPSLPSGVVPLQRGGSTLSVRVGVVAGDVRTRAAADSVADQLRAAGIATEVRALTSAELYGPALTGGDVDLVVGWRTASVTPATRLASAVECDQTDAAPASGTASSGAPASGSATPSSVPTTTTGTSTADQGGGRNDSDQVRFPSNVSGLCDPTLVGLAARAMGSVDPIADLRTAAAVIAEQHVYLPVYQDSMLTAIGPGVRDVPLQGPVGTAIFGATGGWRLADR
ncbi:ABC transporter family substrate-binding protein [Williamsia herbipolensis]|uniref:ABC transporter family substrate-binding protein n=1 Tax=Williamsia herbipolensis TaxID=1603258 RepID=A0AAU4K5F4_9NOCA|nr:ABC transporter family substrate-binding protein [Williamsia herbipolensis]